MCPNEPSESECVRHGRTAEQSEGEGRTAKAYARRRRRPEKVKTQTLVDEPFPGKKKFANHP